MSRWSGWSAVLVALASLVATLACRAPRARALEGSVADAVSRGMATGEEHFDHSAWDALLRRHVDSEGGVDYLGLQEERAALDAYLEGLSEAPLDRLSREALLALLIDAYNACTVRLILEHTEGDRLPGSIRDIDAPWTTPRCELGGETLTLDDIEHGLLRPLFRDARIHAAVNCAARSCPRLRSEAFTGEEVDEQLERAMRDMVASEWSLRIEGERLLLSKIFDWYAVDFEAEADTLVAYVRRFADADVRERLDALGPDPSVGFLDYDWALNRR